jgi:Tfp pilus assembly protein PilO
MKTKNLAVSILVGVLVVALWYMELLKPTRTKVASVKSDTTVQEQKLAPLQRQLSQAQADAAHAAEFKAQLQSLQLAMPDSPALAAFLRDANGIASAAGVTWQSVSHAPPVPGLGGVQSITVGLQVQGTYGQIVEYVSRLASMKRLLVVDSLQLATSTNGAAAAGGDTGSSSTGPFSGGNQLTATISARMFATPGAAAAAASGSTGTSSAPASSTASTPSSG